MLSFIPFLLKGALSLGVLAYVFTLFYFREKPYQTLYLAYQDSKIKDPERFDRYGFWLYCGLMGSGKTVSMTEYIYRMKQKYPKLHIAGNFTHALLDETFQTWQDLIKIQNPLGVKYGVLIAFDEIHLTFASDNWKSAPDNLLEYISMGRKNHKQIIASSQVYNRVNKKLREQTNYIVECKTILNRWTFNKAFITEEYMVNADLKDSGRMKRDNSWKYNFVQTNHLRDLFDSYELIADLYQPKSDLISISDLVEAVNNSQA